MNHFFQEKNKTKEKKTFYLLDYPNKGDKIKKYKGLYPSNAASKAFHQLAKDYNFIDNHNGEKYLVFYLQDVESKKIYPFIGTIIVLKNPIEINYKNKNVKIHHRILVSKFDKDMEKVFHRK